MHRRRISPHVPTRYPGSSYTSLLVYSLALLTILVFVLTRSLRVGAASAALARRPSTLTLRPLGLPPTMDALRAEIERAALAGTVELDWSSRGLTELPPEIGRLTRLEKLNLAGNELSSLPAELAACTALRTLFFLNNRFTAIPSVVGRLPSLAMLSFKSNRVERIPEDALPPSLVWLILTDNALAALPAALGRLPLLRKLMLASNQLRALPDLSGLASLELVRLSDNHLTAFPEALLALPRLAWVAVAGNEFAPVPRSAVDARLSAASSALTLADVELGDVLGEGTSGIVHAATRRGAGGGSSGGADRIAVKIFKAASSDGRPVDEVAASLAITAPHENLINLLGFVAERDAGSGAGGAGHYSKLASFLEFVSGMKVLAKPPSFSSVTRDVYPQTPGSIQALSLAQAGVISLAVASAAAHLHASGIAHGDLYAHNILVDPAYAGAEAPHAQDLRGLAARVKLGDLGAAFFYDRASATGALVERVEVRAWACLAEELLALVPQGAQASDSTGLGAALLDLSRACGAQGGAVAARPSFADIVSRLSAATAGL